MSTVQRIDRRGHEKESCTPGSRVTRSLLGYGVLAGPFYVVAVLVQAMFRPGFDLLHDDASLLANGDLGWIQVANFLVTGACVVAFAADPMNGFPAGTPAGRPEAISMHGILHLVAAGIGFLCLVAACMVMARRF